MEQIRDDYWRGDLALDYIQRFKDLGDWQWGPSRPGSWRHGYDTLKRYAESRATVLVIEADENGVDLPGWMALQRAAYINLQLNKNQIDLLQSLPDWTWDSDEFRWRQGMLAVATYIRRHGSLDSVSRDTCLGGYPLGQWLHRCREDYRAQDLAPSRTVELETKPGWSWGPHEDRWLEGYTCLLRFVEVHGYAAPSQKTVFEGFTIGWWVTKKRRQYRQGSLPAAHIQALESLPGWEWDPQEAQWCRGFEALKVYTENHGSANPRRGETVGEYPVGDWARTQRDAFASGRLAEARTSRLASLPGWRWDLTAGAE
ncbi:helicase associated domain-containing protein [Mycolicibacterium bacteremicum]|uniref:helicase associated domain-containing protein n=1 Tax=Mycolicibacterium bacteremicum TaxID=564198 RepID=UPI0026EEF0A7|nr:helicase associated domain-containing protein [Mycolicibacterium bacteremicum]